MKPEHLHSARDFIDNLAASGRSSFSKEEAQRALGGSQAATAMALGRLRERQLIASPARGFYVIVPPEYRALGCRPAEQFVPALMAHVEMPYYAGLLTAAGYYGSTHQQPMEFQVFVRKVRRPIVCGRVRVVFLLRQGLNNVPVQQRNTPQGYVTVSTPEATALDLIGYQNRAGGLSNVATVLSALADRLDSRKLAEAAAFAPVPWAQRLGYILDHVGATATTEHLKHFVRRHAHAPVALLPAKPYTKTSRVAEWRVYVNMALEVDA